VLEIRNLNQFYGESHTLWDLEISISEGSCTCIMGRNGVGKTTLLKAIMGSIPIKGGAIEFFGKDLASAGPERRAQSGIGYVPQGREIFPQLSVEENLLLGLAAKRSSHNGIPDRIFKLFPVLKEMIGRRGGDLSGGQQQQLAIGRALMTNPKLLILDEPTEGIQPNIVKHIGDVLLQLNEEEKLTVLLVEQKLPFARRVGKSFVILDRGRRVALGAMSELSEEIVSRHLVV
jgi:urea transport system ATP-binding protein